MVNLFIDNVAFQIAEFLEMTEAQKRKYERRVKLCELTRRSFLRRGYRHAFDNYQKNLDFGDEGVYSYRIRIIQLDWIKLTAKREGRRSFGNSKQQSYAIKELADNWGFTEIK